MACSTDKYFLDKLGVKAGKALGILYKKIRFDQAVRLKEDICCRCGEKITDIDDFTIDHIEPWIHSEDPVDRFYNLDNIGYAHSKCNKPYLKRHSREKVKIS